MAEVDLLIKLFDTLKDASKDTYKMCQALLTNQNDIGSYIKSLPMKELQEALKDHSKESTDDIGTCTETVETTSDLILKEMKDMTSRVKNMIVVVIVAFTLFSAASLVGVISYKIQHRTDSSHVDVYDSERAKQEHEDLKKEIIEIIREEWRKHDNP